VSSIRVIQGDCLEVMRGLEAESVDSIVTDPPYGLTFMGKNWDHGVPGGAFWEEALRVAKPGAMLLAFGGTRTHHRLMCAIEDAGWEIRDVLCWLYGSGFPKSHDIGKAIDKSKGAKREVVGNKAELAGRNPVNHTARHGRTTPLRSGWEYNLTAPATGLARTWDGWGTALKPAYEPIVLAMKPLDGTFAGNAEKHGVAGLWIEGCRVSAANYTKGGQNSSIAFGVRGLGSKQPRCNGTSGRWPPNLVLSHHPECVRRGVKRVRANQSSAPGSGKGHEETEGHGIYRGVGGRVSKSTAAPDGTETVEDWACHADCPVRMLGEQSGVRKSVVRVSEDKDVPAATYSLGRKGTTPRGHADQGSCARFFPNFSADGDETARFLYCPKAGRKERNAGLPEGETSTHPTVKPIALMEWLLRLTKTPTGGVGLDMFGGSGTTGVAAVNTGRDWILIEKDAEYCEIARKRIEHARKQRGAKQGALSI